MLCLYQDRNMDSETNEKARMGMVVQRLFPSQHHIFRGGLTVVMLHMANIALSETH